MRGFESNGNIQIPSQQKLTAAASEEKLGDQRCAMEKWDKDLHCIVTYKQTICILKMNSEEVETKVRKGVTFQELPSSVKQVRILEV